MTILKRFAAKLPATLQNELKRLRCRRQILSGSFGPNEPEYALLHEFIEPGDWVIDVGANLGHYTKRFSELAGEYGRVLAFEPVPSTFALLAANAQLFSNANVTLVNAAISNAFGVVGFEIPKLSTGLYNYYVAHVSNSPNAQCRVVALTLDSLQLTQRVSLIKIDAEGHEQFVLEGMMKLIRQDLPTLIIEGSVHRMTDTLGSLGYRREVLPLSPNELWRSPYRCLPPK